MISGSIPKRYARALVELAREQDALELVLADLRSLQDLFKAQPQIAQLMIDPSHPREQRAGILDKVLGDRMRKVSRDFLMLLARRNRLSELDAIIRQYQEMMDAYQGVVRVEVTSAATLSSQVEAQLIELLSTRLGKKVVLTRKVDAAILGGLITQVGNVVYDGSIAAHLRRIRKELLEGRAA